MASEPHHSGHRKRLKERFLAEPKALPDYELLEILLFNHAPRQDVKPLAKELIAHFGSFAKVLTAPRDELKKWLGLGGLSAIASVTESATRLVLEGAKEKPVLNSWLKVVDYLKIEMANLKEEQFRVLFLNAKNMLVKDEVQNKGTINHTMAYPREILRRVLEVGASSIILVHNHPSGDFTPSRADIDLTHQIVQAAKPLGVGVIDHMIISEKGHYSFKTNGLI